MVTSSEHTECAICFEDLESLGGSTPLPCECRIPYCSDCWDRSLAASISACGRALCPSCRGAMRVDFDASKGRLLFSRAFASELGPDAPDDDWRKRLYEQAKPRQIELLQRFGEQQQAVLLEAVSLGADAADRDCTSQPARAELQPVRCVCGSRLTEISVRDRVLAFVQEESPITPPRSVVERLMQSPPIVCDICFNRVHATSKVWTCENGRRTMLHAVAYDVCESCFVFHAYGIENMPGHEEHGGGDDNVSISDDDANSFGAYCPEEESD